MRWAVRLILLAAILTYAVLICSWWQEGTENFERQRVEACEDWQAVPLDRIDKMPEGCRTNYGQSR